VGGGDVRQLERETLLVDSLAPVELRQAVGAARGDHKCAPAADREVQLRQLAVDAPDVVGAHGDDNVEKI
jgi:hypothetical protein